MAFRLKCPECAGKFPWTLEAQWPRYCPLCQADINNEREDDDIVMPAFLSAKTKATDKVYNDIVKGSEYRAEAAAQLAGTSVEEMSSLKITNLNTRRDAEIMAITPNNAVSQVMAAAPNVTGFQGAAGAAYSGAVSSGPFASAGARTRTMIHTGHADAVQRHAVGVDHNGRTVRPSDSGVSDRPALETTQPGYRRRG